VAEENLDRDPPSPGEFKFQVVAREVGAHSAASAPLFLTVQLLDVNDNTPEISSIPPLTIEAGDGKRDIYQVIHSSTGMRFLQNQILQITHTSGSVHLPNYTCILEVSGLLGRGRMELLPLQWKETSNTQVDVGRESLHSFVPNYKLIMTVMKPIRFISSTDVDNYY